MKKIIKPLYTNIFLCVVACSSCTVPQIQTMRGRGHMYKVSAHKVHASLSLSLKPRVAKGRWIQLSNPSTRSSHRQAGSEAVALNGEQRSGHDLVWVLYYYNNSYRIIKMMIIMMIISIIVVVVLCYVLLYNWA